MTGASGATFVYHDDNTVTKLGDIRVVEQGRWLQRRPEPMLPHVLGVAPFGYKMERLSEVHNTTPHIQLLDSAAWNLRLLWGRVRFGYVNYYEPMHIAKVNGLISIQRMRDKVAQLRQQIDWSQLAQASTHGDPTLENVMMREGTYVLIDPIPATHAVPDLACVDVGKMLQSVLGYEAIRGGQAWELTPQQLRSIFWLDTDEHEWLATRYWCVVHLLRAIPYAKQPSVVQGLWRLVDHALDLV